MNTILTTGATGNLGRAVVKSLSAKGFKVKATARNLAKAAFPEDVETVRFDYQDPAIVDLALKGLSLPTSFTDLSQVF